MNNNLQIESLCNLESECLNDIDYFANMQSSSLVGISVGFLSLILTIFLAVNVSSIAKINDYNLSIESPRERILIALFRASIER